MGEPNETTWLVDGDLAEGRVAEGLREHRRGLHVVPFPEPGEVGAGIAEFVDEAAHSGVGGVTGEGGVELRHDAHPEVGGVGDSVERRIGGPRSGEGPAREVAVLGGERGEVLHERGREVVSGEDLERGGHHEAGRPRQPLQERGRRRVAGRGQPRNRTR